MSEGEKVLMKNIQSLNCSSCTKIFNKNIFNVDLKFLGKFDIIFLDPPFKYKDIGKLISILINKNILKKRGIIILHRHKNDRDNFPKKFRVIKQINYGISNIYFGN